jgi:hypothetical protein
MQPYLFPYIGYFQLIAQSDVFVFNDDVQFIKGGWINRNRILSRLGEKIWITMPVAAASHKRTICERVYASGRNNRFRILRQLENHYSHALNVGEIIPFVREILEFNEANVAGFNVNLLKAVSERLGLKTRFLLSSEVQKTSGLSGQARVIDICRRLGATRYVNPIGGTHLYDANAFAEQGIELRFLHSAIKARDSEALYLSIVHNLMCESTAALRGLIEEYRILPGRQVYSTTIW